MKVSATDLWDAAVERRHTTWARRTLHAAKHKARAKGLPLNIGIEHIETPEFCPVSLHKLNYFNRKRDWDSPTLERRDPGLGWIVGNVITVSYWISSVKGSRTWEQFEPQAMKILAAALSRAVHHQPPTELEVLRREINDDLG